MTSGIQTVIYPVKDLASAKATYGALLGAEPTMEAPYYMQYDVNGLQIGFDPNGHQQGLTGPVVFYTVPDAAAALEGIVAAGGSILAEPRDVGGGMLVARAADADGNTIGVKQNP